jgi:hypothetical protein
MIVANAAAAPPKVKITGTRLPNPAETRTPGEEFSVRARIVNTGGTTTLVDTSVQVRTDEGWSSVGDEQVGPAQRKRQGTKQFEIHATLPEDLPNGLYDLRTCILRRGTTGASVCMRADDQLDVVTWVDGARSAGDPYLPVLGNGGYDAQHYDLTFNYDPTVIVDSVKQGNRFLEGTHSLMTAKATQSLKSFSMDFLPNSPYTRCTTTNNAANAKTCTPKPPGLTISSITVNGQPATWEQINLVPPAEDANTWNWGESKTIITPQVSARPRAGETFTVDIAYTGEPQEIFGQDLDWEGWLASCRPNKNTPTFCDGSYVVNEPSGAQGWFPNNNRPDDKATYDFYITVPTGKQVVANGELESRTTNDDGTTTWHWNEDSPMMSYLTTATVGSFNFNSDVTQQTMTETSTSRTLDVNNFVDPASNSGNLTTINANLAQTPAMVNWLSGAFGPYPHNSTGALVDFLQGVGYALEVQTKPAFAGGSATVGTLLHEHAHQWFGGGVGPATWREIWFNEGWATFATNEWQFAANGSATAPSQSFWTFYNAGGTAWGTRPAALTGPSQLFSTTPVYNRPAHTIQGYRQIMGDAAFFAWAKDLMSTFGDENGAGVITTQQFIDFAVDGYAGTVEQKALLNTYFEQWLRGNVKPTLTPLDFGTYLPVHISQVASPVASTTASIAVRTTNLGQAGTVRVQYGLTDSYGTNTATQVLTAGAQNLLRTYNLTGLAPGTTYHFRAEATNTQGTTTSVDGTFTTAP